MYIYYKYLIVLICILLFEIPAHLWLQAAPAVVARVVHQRAAQTDVSVSLTDVMPLRGTFLKRLKSGVMQDLTGLTGSLWKLTELLGKCQQASNVNKTIIIIYYY